jgi:hypothetical protein
MRQKIFFVLFTVLLGLVGYWGTWLFFRAIEAVM